MKQTGRVFLIAAAVSLGACANVDTCEEPEFYESAVGGKRIASPEGLNDLAASKEMVIPEASPREPRPPGSGCLDRPPTLSTEEKET